MGEKEKERKKRGEKGRDWKVDEVRRKRWKRKGKDEKQRERRRGEEEGRDEREED